MLQRDFNGTGKWAVDAVQARYADYAARFGGENPLALLPKVYAQGMTRWTYPIMEAVIDGIKAGDAACFTIGVEFIEEDKKFPFGSNLKSSTARALRQNELPNALVVRIRRCVADMLQAGNTPREYREYAKLLRKIGFSAGTIVNPLNPVSVARLVTSGVHRCTRNPMHLGSVRLFGLMPIS